MKKYKVSWEAKDGCTLFRDIDAESGVHAMAYVEREIKAMPLRKNVIMLYDGFITQFDVEEILS